MAEVPLAQTLSAAALSPLDLLLALHFGLGIDAALLQLEVTPADAIATLRTGAMGELVLAAPPAIPWDNPAEIALVTAARSDQLRELEGKLLEAAFRALKKFLQLAATPEQRLVLAERHGWAYDDLTNWVIRADLLRLHGMRPLIAELLALVVVGVYDLAFQTERPGRRPDDPELDVGRQAADLGAQLERRIAALDDHQLRQRLEQSLHQLDLPDVIRRAREHAQRHRPQVVTSTAVILVVKGAGEQRPDETLDGFLNGFWPAMKLIDPQATITQRSDLFTQTYLPPPHETEPHPHCIEIKTGERRVWVKESHWECELRPPSPWQALSVEWRMATYAFGSTLYELFLPSDADPRANHIRQYWLSFFVQYWAIFCFLSLTFWNSAAHLVDLRLPLSDLPGRWLYRITLEPLLGAGPWRIGLLSIVDAFGLAALAAAVLAALRAWQTNRVKRRAQRVALDPAQGGLDVPPERLPTLSRVLLVIAIVAFLVNPLHYLQGLIVLILMQVLLVLMREAAWPFRDEFNSDVNSVMADTERRADGWHIVMRVRNKVKSIVLSPIVYRFTVVLGLPIVFLVLAVSYLLRFLPVLRDLAAAVETWLSGTISGVLGDVVTYASDPAQAARIRSVIETDIAFFHQRPDVSALHVFAHSQGTPITYETLFHHLPELYRRKITSYVTIGSILSYYHQANPVLDVLYVPRFPRRPYPQFAPDFRWINFWNMNDPITEFYGLDEYQFYTLAPADDGTAWARRVSSSPINIRTTSRWFPYASHGAYWSDVWQVHVPLVYWVLGDTAPDAWLPPDETAWQAQRPRLRYPRLFGSHLRVVGCGWALLLALLAASVWGLWLLAAWLWSAGRTWAWVVAVYGWLTAQRTIPFTDQPLPLIGTIRQVLDDQYTMRNTLLLLLLALVLVLLLVVKSAIARWVRQGLIAGARGQPTQAAAQQPPAGTSTPVARADAKGMARGLGGRSRRRADRGRGRHPSGPS